MIRIKTHESERAKPFAKMMEIEIANCKKPRLRKTRKVEHQIIHAIKTQSVSNLGHRISVQSAKFM